MLDAVPSRRRVSGHRHRGVDWLLAIALVAATLWYAVRWLDVATFPVAVAQSLVPVAGIGLVLITTHPAGPRPAGSRPTASRPTTSPCRRICGQRSPPSPSLSISFCATISALKLN